MHLYFMEGTYTGFCQVVHGCLQHDCLCFCTGGAGYGLQGPRPISLPTAYTLLAAIYIFLALPCIAAPQQVSAQMCSHNPQAAILTKEARGVGRTGALDVWKGMGLVLEVMVKQ